VLKKKLFVATSILVLCVILITFVPLLMEFGIQRSAALIALIVLLWAPFVYQRIFNNNEKVNRIDSSKIQLKWTKIFLFPYREKKKLDYMEFRMLMFKFLYIVVSIVVLFIVLAIFEDAPAVAWLVSVLITYSWIRFIYKKVFLKGVHKESFKIKIEKLIKSGMKNKGKMLVSGLMNFFKFTIIYFIVSFILLSLLSLLSSGEAFGLLLAVVMAGYFVTIVVYTPFRRSILFFLGFGVLSPDVITDLEDFEEIDSSPQENPDPMNVKSNNHVVEAHYVSGYERKDGTSVDGYWRDGDGNTSIDRDDGVYLRSNPDDRIDNNLN